MRHGGRAVWAIAATAGLVVCALGTSAQAGTANGRDKIDPAVAAAVAAGGDRVPVLIGGDLGRIDSRHGLAPGKRFRSVGAESTTVSPAELDALAADPAVTAIAPDAPVLGTGSATPVDGSQLATLFPLVDGTGPAWSAGIDGAGVGVVVIDTGAAPLPDFGARVVHVDLGGGIGGGGDAIGHGTFVTGVLAGASADGRHLGVAPAATIYAVDVSRTEGTRTSDVIQALDWVLVNRRALDLRVVNLSLAETLPSEAATNPLDAAVETLWRAGVVVVAASGNLGPGTMDFAPANDPLAITVGALDDAGTLATADDVEAPWSSSGTTADGFPKPEVLAPGRHVISTLPSWTVLGAEAPAANVVEPGYVMANGTSFAAPQVSAAAALLLARHPRWEPGQVKAVLAGTSRPVAGATAGALDVGAAISYRGPMQPAGRGAAYAHFGAPGAAGGGAVSTDRSSATWNASADWSRSSATWNASATWNSSPSP